jgi:hypothetical protein
LVILSISCVPQANDSTVLSLTRTVDSLKTTIQQERNSKDSVIASKDSLTAKFKAWVILTFDAEKHCISDATAIKGNPALNAANAVNWITRDFKPFHDPVWKKR